MGPRSCSDRTWRALLTQIMVRQSFAAMVRPRRRGGNRSQAYYDLPNDGIRPQQQRLRNRKAECVRSFQVDHQLELGRLLDGKVRELGAFQDLVHVRRRVAEGCGKVGRVTDQPACVHVLAPPIRDRPGWLLTPVMLLPGRARLAMNRLPTGSPTLAHADRYRLRRTLRDARRHRAADYDHIDVSFDQLADDGIQPIYDASISAAAGGIEDVQLIERAVIDRRPCSRTPQRRFLLDSDRDKGESRAECSIRLRLPQRVGRP